MALVVRNSNNSHGNTTTQRVEPKEIEVFGVIFQAFKYPESELPVFSQAGVARGLRIAESSARDLLRSKAFKSKRGKDYSPTRMLTTINSVPIAVVTMADLNALVAVAAGQQPHPQGDGACN